MEPDDDLIRRAIGAGRAHPSPPDSLLERAAATGRARRKRRLVALVGTLAIGMVVVGAAVIGRDRDAIVEVSVGVSPTPPPASASVTSTSASPTSASPSSTIWAASAPPTSPPIVEPNAEPLACDPAPELTVDRVVVSVLGASPDRFDAILQARFAGDGTSSIEVWSADGLAATVGDDVADNPEQRHCPTSLVPVGYDGRFLWATVTGADRCSYCPGPREATRLFRADIVSGAVVELWSTSSATLLYEVLPRGDGGASVLTGPRKDSGVLAVVDVTSEGVASNTELVWPVESPVADAKVWRGAPAGGRPSITFTTGAPRSGSSALHVITDVATRTELVVDLTGTIIDPVITGWSADGSAMVLLEEQWEGIGTDVLVAVDLAAPQRSTASALGSAACWADTGLIARATWSFGTESSYEEAGGVELVDPVGLSIVADLGLDTYGGELACLSGERVALTAYDAIPSDRQTGQQAAIVSGSQRSLLVDRTSIVELTRDPDLRVVTRNASD